MMKRTVKIIISLLLSLLILVTSAPSYVSAANRPISGRTAILRSDNEETEPIVEPSAPAPEEGEGGDNGGGAQDDDPPQDPAAGQTPEGGEPSASGSGSGPAPDDQGGDPDSPPAAPSGDGPSAPTPARHPGSGVDANGVLPDDAVYSAKEIDDPRDEGALFFEVSLKRSGEKIPVPGEIELIFTTLNAKADDKVTITQYADADAVLHDRVSHTYSTDERTAVIKADRTVTIKVTSFGLFQIDIERAQNPAPSPAEQPSGNNAAASASTAYEAPGMSDTPDYTADVESIEYWDELAKSYRLTGNWTEDVPTVAKAQLGYHASTSNYIRNYSKNRVGYTRYGHWYSLYRYGKTITYYCYEYWCADFVSFCLFYAGVPEDIIPYNKECSSWSKELENRGLFITYTHDRYGNVNYVPSPGDLIFFDYDFDKSDEHVGIVTGVDEDTGLIHTIEGNVDWSVTTKVYLRGSGRIRGFASIEKAYEEYRQTLSENASGKASDLTVPTPRSLALELEQRSLKDRTPTARRSFWDFLIKSLTE